MAESDKQELKLINREFLTISGVEDVMNYNQLEINLKTDLGKLKIAGEELNIKELDLERNSLIVTGKVSLLEYDREEKPAFLSRIFR